MSNCTSDHMASLQQHNLSNTAQSVHCLLVPPVAEAAVNEKNVQVDQDSALHCYIFINKLILTEFPKRMHSSRFLFLGSCLMQ